MNAAFLWTMIEAEKALVESAKQAAADAVADAKTDKSE